MFLQTPHEGVDICYANCELVAMSLLVAYSTQSNPLLYLQALCNKSLSKRVIINDSCT
jgi:hypothetical protein